MADHDPVAFARHVSLQTVLDDRQRELEQRPIGLLHLKCGFAVGDGALLDTPLLSGRARRAGQLVDALELAAARELDPHRLEVGAAGPGVPDERSLGPLASIFCVVTFTRPAPSSRGSVVM